MYVIIIIKTEDDSIETMHYLKQTQEEDILEMFPNISNHVKYVNFKKREGCLAVFRLQYAIPWHCSFIAYRSYSTLYCVFNFL